MYKAALNIKNPETGEWHPMPIFPGATGPQGPQGEPGVTPPMVAIPQENISINESGYFGAELSLELDHKKIIIRLADGGVLNSGGPGHIKINDREWDYVFFKSMTMGEEFFYADILIEIDCEDGILKAKYWYERNADIESGAPFIEDNSIKNFLTDFNIKKIESLKISNFGGKVITDFQNITVYGR